MLGDMELPSAHNTVAQNVADVAGLGSAAYYARLRAEGRSGNDNALFAPIPPGDPGYLVGNAGGMVILHFLIPILLAVFLVPALVIGALPFGAAIFAVDHWISNPAAYIFGWFIALPLYTYLIFWRVGCRIIIAKMFKVLFT